MRISPASSPGSLMTDSSPSGPSTAPPRTLQTDQDESDLVHVVRSSSEALSDLSELSPLPNFVIPSINKKRPRENDGTPKKPKKVKKKGETEADVVVKAETSESQKGKNVYCHQRVTLPLHYFRIQKLIS
ncbi:hypothetical protein M231_03392 [Tremella mesenterica]|uniref:Uncharacterized protein n=1 Tax=Tremella mesenterica TaxID=5217 RepID=A0A4Q1BN77_TREME|nr:hypothetical protein M231_03392 [Tremella mesenterica]